MGLARHLRDDRLFECYANERASTPLDPRTAEHLADCPACAARYGELTAFMESLSAEAVADTDAVFTPDRLRLQQQQVARRIEHIGRPARVISFPAPLADHLHTRRPSYVPSRWMAGAVAAGLVMGIGVGITFEWERHGRAGTARYAPVVAGGVTEIVSGIATGPAATPSSIANANDESFLSDLDVALERPRFGGELQTFDALTPHVREIRDSR
jgi:anti-sigma factor RsiW